MSLTRRQLFEWNDLAWVPSSLRDSIVESLSRALDWGGMLNGLVQPFSDFLAATGSNEVLDLCAGAAGPARILARAIGRAGTAPPRFILTDLYPRLDAWEKARDEHPGILDFEPSPVDATRIPAAIAEGRARIVINAFHHFPPHVARTILADAVTSSRGIFISECFDRNPLRFLTFAPAGLAALIANPLLSPGERTAKAALTWFSPIALTAGTWDGLVSTLRVYSEEELFAMVAPLGDTFRFHYGTYAYAPFGKGTYFYGIPR